MVLTLNEALKDPIILEELRHDPESFRFNEAPYVVVTQVPFAPHVIMNKEDYSSPMIKAGIPTVIPFTGTMSHMMEILSTSLNFTYEQVMPADSSWGSISANGTWSGMVGQVHRKEVDMGLGPFTTILSRFNAVDMSIPFFFDTLAMLVASGSAAINPWGFLLPLSTTVWGVFLAMLILVCLVHFFLECQYQPKSKWIHELGSVFFEYVQPPMDIALTRMVWRSWQRPLIGAWILVSLLMNSSYSGNLKSMMALRHIPHPIQTLRDLIDDASVKIIIEHRSSYIATVKRVPSGDVKEMSEVGEAGRYVDLKMRNFLSHEHLLRRGDHVQILDTMLSLYFRAKLFSDTGRCDFYLARETFIPFMYTMIGQKHSPLTPAINARLRRVNEAGLYKHWISNSIANVTACANPPMKVTSMNAIAFGNIWGVAVIWGAGMLLATIGFTLEFIFFSTCIESREPRVME